jgi:Tfp pilus assembly protein PilN
MYTTLNISNTSLRLLSVSGRRVTRWGESALDAGLVRDGLILKPAAVAEAIGALFREKGVPRENVITCLTGMVLTYRFLTLPQMKPSLWEEAIWRAARKEIPLPLEELYLTFKPAGSRPGEQDYFVAGVARHIVDALVETLAAASIEPYLMDLNTLSLARAANRGEAIIVSVEPDYFDIVIVAGGAPAILYTVSPRWAGASPDENARQLVDELLKSVGFHNSNHPQEPVSPGAPLLLTGSLSVEKAFTELIQSETDYPVEPLVPPLKFPDDLPVAAYAANMGLALKKVPAPAVKGETVRFRDINANLLSAKYRKPRKPPVPVKRFLGTVFIVLLLALLYPAYQLYSQVKDAAEQRLMDFSRIDQELYQAEMAVVRAAETEGDILNVDNAAEALREEHRSILARRGEFTGDMRLIIEALPPQALLTSVKMAAEQLTLRGETDSPYSVIGYALALEASGRFAGVRITEIDEVPAAEADAGDIINFTIAVSK